MHDFSGEVRAMRGVDAMQEGLFTLAKLNDFVVQDPEYYGEIFAEDIDEFSKAREIDAPDDISPMAAISEAAFKGCIAEILG